MSFYNAVKGKGLVKTASRGLTIFRRYGLSKAKMEKNIVSFIDLMRRHDAIPTFPVPAVIFEKYYSFFEKLQNDAEFAVHGYVHNDYSLMDPATIKFHLEQSIAIFKSRGIPNPGFRAPYLRFNPKHIDFLKSVGYSYDSSLSIHFDVLGTKNAAYNKAIEYYNPVTSVPESSFPRYPVSLPDDEMLIDRMGLKNSSHLAGIWTQTMNRAIINDRFFALQLHPERFHIAKEALSSLLATARQSGHPILPLLKAQKTCISITGDIDALSLNDFRS